MVVISERSRLMNACEKKQEKTVKYMVGNTSIPHICHLDDLYIGGEKIGHVEKFQISIHNRCGEI